MNIDKLAYDLFLEEFSSKFNFKSKIYGDFYFFMKNKKSYKKYYDKANSIIRKEKLKALNEI